MATLVALGVGIAIGIGIVLWSSLFGSGGIPAVHERCPWGGLLKTVLSSIFIAVVAIGCQTTALQFSTDTIGRLSFKRTVSINGKEQTFKWNIPAEEMGPILSHLKPRGPSGDFLFVCGSEDGILSVAGKKTKVHWCREKSATPIVYFTILEKEYKLEEPYSVDFYNAIGKYAPPGFL